MPAFPNVIPLGFGLRGRRHLAGICRRDGGAVTLKLTGHSRT